jgi:hypothetical protein
LAATKRRSKKNRGTRNFEARRKSLSAALRAHHREASSRNRTAHSAHKVGEIYLCDFSAADLRVLTQTFFTAFARATVTQRLWTGEEFWFFSLGAVLWLIAFFGLPRPILIYVFGHELTHALWVWLMGGHVSQFRVGADGGHVVTTKANFWIALAPYFFPIYSILTIAFTARSDLFFKRAAVGRLLYAVIGATWAFHFTFTCWMIPKNQTDLTDQGTFFSLVVIYLMNLLLLSVC